MGQAPRNCARRSPHFTVNGSVCCLPFGHAPSPLRARPLPLTVNKQLAALLPDLFTPATIRESYHYIDTANTGSVDFNAYFFASSCGRALSRPPTTARERRLNGAPAAAGW